MTGEALRFNFAPPRERLPNAEARGDAGEFPVSPMTAVRESAADNGAGRRGTGVVPSAVPVGTVAQPGEEVSASPANVGADPDGLRPYQRTAVTRIREELAATRSTLLVMATGLGKTQTFGALAAHWPGRVLVLAHRDELIQQAQRRLQDMAGEYVDLEQASFRAGGSRIVVGSVQTLCRQARLERFRPDAFSLIVVDEAHHAIAPTYRRILGHFSGAKVLGVTATPDRADERAMGQVFDTVAYVRDIRDGIADGYLCPLKVRQVDVEAIDLSAVGTVAGDLNQGELDAVMAVEEALHGVARPTIEHAGDRRAIVFSTSVANAHRLAEVFNRYKPDSARAVDGTTDFDVRRRLLREHQEGRFQFLCNVGVLTEGYDDPGVSCVVMARPTKSRALYAQMIGRGLRIAPGKADCLAIDIAGNSGRHALVTAIDILAGTYDDEVVAKAKKKAADNPGMDASEALAEAAREVEADRERAAKKRAAIKAKVKHTSREIDPFAFFGLHNPEHDSWAERYRNDPTVAQVETLKKLGIDDAGLTKAQASKLIDAASKRRAAGFASMRQVRMLAKLGIQAPERLSSGVASRLCGAVFQNKATGYGWGFKPGEAAEILSAGRAPGEDA
jgi:superfamily II DNA or RNA helicase